MRKILLFICIGSFFLGCDDEIQPSGGGQARIIINAPTPAQGESFGATTLMGSLYTPGSTDLMSVTKGQNVYCTVSYYTTTNVCKNVEVKFELNGNIIDTRQLSMGGPNVIICQDGYTKSLNFIVP